MSAQSADDGTAVHAGETLALNNNLTAKLEDSITPTPAPISDSSWIPVIHEPSLPDQTTASDPSVPASVPSADSATNINPQLITDTSLAQGDLWKRIRAGFGMPELDSPLVKRQEQWYAHRPDYVARMTERSRRYLYFITQEVQKRGMPTEIALLPMIESAFNPGACSFGNASGIWQFIPSTARTFGLRQNWWYDGRRDIVNATMSALDYLQKLHDQFGDWELALAAYNWGEGAVERAQEYNRRRGLPTDYASLKMPAETRNYVPKLLAVKHIIDEPEKFGLTLYPIPDQPYFTAVTTTHHIDVKLAAKLADISLEEFNALNPAHNRPVILEENADVLLLPVDKAETFRNNLKNYTEPLVSWQAYKTKNGERLDRVAPRFGISLAKLRSVNGLSPRAKRCRGQELLVPLNGEDADNEFEAFNTHLAPTYAVPVHSFTHIVKNGETVHSISHRYHVSLNKLQSWNSDLAHIKPGQHIIIVRTASRPHRIARVSRKHIRLASAKGRKHSTHKAQVRESERVAYNH